MAKDIIWMFIFNYKIDNILIEEINKMKIGGGLGSWRGYGTFVESKLYENTVKAVLFKIGKLEKCIWGFTILIYQYRVI